MDDLRKDNPRATSPPRYVERIWLEGDETKPEKSNTYDRYGVEDGTTEAQDFVTFSPAVFQCRFQQPLYRYKFPGPGVFRCDLTNLVFVMAKEAELTYMTLIWDEDLLNSGGKTPAGPLFQIKSAVEDALTQLRFPHSETKEAMKDGALSVADISDEGMSILKPLEMTETHVVVDVPHLSSFGLVWHIIKRFMKNNRPIRSQLMLYLRTPIKELQIMTVIVLQDNVPLHEISRQQNGAQRVRIPSHCQLDFGHKYSIHVDPEDLFLQPMHDEFSPRFGPNYHPTFEVFLDTSTESLNLKLQDQSGKVAWENRLYLQEARWLMSRRKPYSDMQLISHRSALSNGISPATLEKLLDVLIENKILTDEQIASVSAKPQEERAREVLQMVQYKGRDPSTILLAALREVDPVICKELEIDY
ncbi:caspase recruitment domain-containing protein 8-like isoform X1 [Gymnodraco acuticeps]|uniref:Caspase recruitment domain-containing protein 8-like isoform X1 n=1 Tax=Gymnodraco acuticeps TaxID=8218 RepID=A0A6P8SUN3_GYMAC|nr:caspase recruitment domain-containing protein 8-like isoform X1 [Gymnodraco acuticeps]